MVSDLARKLNESLSRVGFLSERLETLERRISFLDSKHSRDFESLKTELERFSSKMDEIDKKMLEIGKGLRKIENSLGAFATKEDFAKVEETLKLFNPLTSEFITRQELHRILDERLR